jgi:virulence-associated protein VagC
MKALVRKDGVLIPKRLLKGAKQVEILEDQGRIIVLPIPGPKDPVFKLGRRPVMSGVAEGSERHDEHIYRGT